MSEINEARRRECEKLSSRGFACLRDGNYGGALEAARNLEELRHSAAFDIGAQAYSALGNTKKAIETLERGVEKAPDVWLNWEFLGSCRSDLGLYDEAEAAYRRALECPNVWKASVRLNQAILANRRGDHDGALAILDSLNPEDPKLRWEATAARMSALQGMGRLEEAAALAENALESESDESAARCLGRIGIRLGQIRLAQGWQKEEIRSFAFDALRLNGASPGLLSLIREIDGQYRENAQYYRLLVHASIPVDSPRHEGARGYYVTYDVVAETPEEALAFVREFEDQSVQEALTIEEATALEPRPTEPLGVYRRTRRAYYNESG